MRKLTCLWTTALALILSAGVGTANAQVNSEPPGVARVSFIRGDVSMQRGDSGDTSAVDLNAPLVAGDKVFTGSNSRAEIQLDWANMLRLDQNAQADIATLENNRIQVQLAQGLAFFSVLKGSDSDAEIDTPNVSIHPRGDGRFRIEVLPSGDTLITARDGDADISTPDGSTLLRENETITVRGTGNDVQFQTARAPGNDEFDRWNSDRDRTIANAESYRRTNRYYAGAADLDAYGRWDNIPDYGSVWVPRVSVGWAPYRQGRWVWTSYWGWTWTSYEPWGWAPYHYGRWFVHGNNWVWWPGPVTPVYRPVYAPAYVSFFGFGSHSAVSVGVSFGGGFGSIGWLPVGPCDYVNPWWGAHRSNFNVVNITNVTNVYNVRNVNVIAPLRAGNRDSNVHNMLINDHVRYGLSTVSADNFGRGHANVRSATTAELREGQMMTGNVPVAPSRESLRTSDRTANIAAARAQNEPKFFSRRVPSTQRESFTAESTQVQQAIDRDPRFGGGNRTADNRGADNRAAGNSAGPGNRNNNAEGNSQRQTPVQSSQPQAQALRSSQPPLAAREPQGGGWRSFGNGASGAAGTSATDSQGIQREPVLRAPRQRGNGSDSLPNRPDAEQRFVAQNGSGNSGNQPQASPQQPQNTDNRQNAWQRFSGGARPSSQGNSSNTAPAAPRTETRPQIQLNRPIIRPRDSSREAATPRDNGNANRGFATAPRGAMRESAPAPAPAPSNQQRFTPAPRSAPQPSTPSVGSQRSAPSGGSSRGAESSNSRARSSERSRESR